MLIFNDDANMEVQAIIELIKQTRDIYDFSKILSILCDIRFSDNRNNHHSFDDFISYYMHHQKEVGAKPVLTNNSSTLKTIKLKKDFEDVRAVVPDICYKNNLLEIFISSLAGSMKMDSQVKVFVEKNFWNNDPYDEIKIVYEPKVINLYS